MQISYNKSVKSLMKSTNLIGMIEHFKLMALETEDITPAKDGGVLKKVLKQGTGQTIPRWSYSKG